MIREFVWTMVQLNLELPKSALEELPYARAVTLVPLPAS